jgi:3-oxoacyl-[acyl-carrier-protein] synthase II
MKETRIVITGLGIVSPIGTGKEKFWEAAVKGSCGVRPLKSIDTTDYKTKTGGEVLDFDASKYLTPEEIKSMGRSSQFACVAASMALEDAKVDMSKENPFRVSVSMGTTMGEPQILDQCMDIKYKEGDSDAIPETLPRQYPAGVIPANVARHTKAKGSATIIPTACAAGNYAIGYAYDQILLGKADMVFAGGSDPFSSLAFTGFNRLLATTPDVPHPFSIDRNGMAVAEGAGMLVIESLEHAEARGATILAELKGYGLACDAFKMTIPAPDGIGGIIAFKKALKHTGIKAEEIDYICAHGTGTGENDKSETLIAKTVLGEERAHKVPMTSLKSMLGHTMGAASAIEAAACIMMINNSKILPTINYLGKDELCDLDYVTEGVRDAELETVVSNAYAFAGNTSAIILKKFRG